MCSRIQFIEYISSNNYERFYKSVSLKLINDDNVFYTAVLLGKSAFTSFMLNKVIEIEEIKRIYQDSTTGSMATEDGMTSRQLIKETLEGRILSMERQFKRGYNRLHIAVIDDEVDLVEHLIKKRPSEVTGSDEVIGTPLHLAVTLHRTSVVGKFVECGADLDLPDKSGLTALMLAVLYNDHESTDAILTGSANVNTTLETRSVEVMANTIKRYCSLTPAMPLSNKENSVTLSLKLYREIRPNMLAKISMPITYSDDGDGNSLLHLAASLQDVTLCRALIGKGVVVDHLNHMGDNALHHMLATRTKMPHSIKKPAEVGTLLIDSGINVDETGSDGRTALFKSSEVNSEKFFIKVFNSISVVDLTVAEFEAIAKRRWFTAVITVLENLTGESRNLRLTSYVVDKFVDFADDSDLKDLWNLCPESTKNQAIDKILDRAARQNKVAIFNEFLEQHTSEPKVLPNGETLFTNQIRSDRGSFASLILESKWGNKLVSLSNSSGESSLHVAIKLKDKTLIDELAVELVDMSSEDKEGESVLGLLFRHFSPGTDYQFMKRIAKIIISKGGNPHHKNLQNVEDIEQCSIANIKNEILEYRRKLPQRKSFKKECSICLDRAVNCSLDCGHVFCDTCVSQVCLCPICREPSASFKKLYL